MSMYKLSQTFVGLSFKYLNEVEQEVINVLIKHEYLTLEDGVIEYGSFVESLLEA